MFYSICGCVSLVILIFAFFLGSNNSFIPLMKLLPVSEVILLWKIVDGKDACEHSDVGICLVIIH